MLGLKSCKSCNKDLPITDFGPYKHSKDRLNYNCRNCWNEIHRNHRQKNLDKIRDYDKKRRPFKKKHIMTDAQKLKAKEYRLKHREKRIRDTKAWQAKNKEVLKERRKEYVGKNREKVRLLSRKCILKKKYNISLEQYDIMLKAQDGKCAICLKLATGTLHIDHSHDTGKVRGLLCSNCNTGIGQLKEDKLILTRAMEYLIKYEE